MAPVVVSGVCMCVCQNCAVVSVYFHSHLICSNADRQAFLEKERFFSESQLGLIWRFGPKPEFLLKILKEKCLKGEHGSGDSFEWHRKWKF
jgi:hypothetical protein